jgi:HAMP domain-containing protein
VTGGRFVEHDAGDNRIVVGLPLRSPRAGALVSVAFRRELVAEAGILHTEILRAAALAVLVGAVVGVIVAVLIAARLRRIASAAAAIEAGSFDAELRAGVLGDEVGALAETIDRMRGRLRESFARLESERDRLRRLFEQLQEGVLAVNPALEVELANRAARQIVAGSDLREGVVLPEPWPDLEIRVLAAGLFEEGAGVVQARVSPDDEHTYSVVGIPAGYGSELALLGARIRRQRRTRAPYSIGCDRQCRRGTPARSEGRAGRP